MAVVVYTFSNTEGHGDDSIGTRHTIQATDKVREIVQHTEVMLHNYHIPEGER